ncbi:Oligopeptide transport ATP-binding protein OppF [Klebsiella michiganensis]|uniref:Oligopeptide transport ATP-binding protein OppF n=1 Tax=Klebsiella michiganensis TaxID=1134687 RepID=A0A7H4PL00_9ENTR|nr:Oligopeptide transport ATP-binding protein OppF [Klebsiella michiganensis]
MVGESGCGKSTFARAIIGLVKATDGKVAWLGRDLLGMKADEWRDVRSDIQMIFQDPLASLNPRMTIGGNHRRAAAHLSSQNAAPGSSRSR